MIGPKDIRWKGSAVITLLNGVIAVVLFLSPVRDWIEGHFTRRVEFSFRSFVKLDPLLSDKLKIFAFDDQTARLLEKHDLRLRDWASIFQALGKSGPHGILIDKIWALPVGKNFDRPVSAQEGKAFVKRVRSAGVPITAGSGVLEKKVSFGNLVDLTGYPYDVRSLQTYGEKDDLSWLPITGGFPYGPAGVIFDAFTYVGHIDYGKFASVWPLKRISEDKVVPHSALLAAGKISLVGESLLLDGRPIPLDHRGMVVTNLLPVDVLKERTKSLIPLMQKMNKSQDLGIEPGDFVVILPLMYTGNVDFVETPVGKIQGGYIMTSLLNSALTGQWLKPVFWGVPLIILFLLWSILIANTLRSGQFWAVLGASAGTVVLSSLLCFSFLGWVLPWTFPMAALLINGSLVFAYRTYIMERNTQKLRNALEGSIPPDKLDQIIDLATDFKITPSEKLISIMFIDLVGFSLATERMKPEEAFSYLRDKLQFLSETIHKHGGVVDKNLGDGILCFFGYDYLGGEGVINHADQALECAIDIQKLSMERALSAKGSDAPIFPVRIGINTDKAFIGDVGDSRRIDFTLIGNGVNFASRLESACEPFMIMLGTETCERLEKFTYSPALHQRHIQIKHYETLFDAFEYNPFYDNPKALRDAAAAYRDFAQLQRKDDRIPVIQPGSLFIESDKGSGVILNASLNGFAVELETFLAKGVSKTVHLRSTDEQIDRLIQESGFMPFTLEVCWGVFSEKNHRYLHGLKIKSLNRSQCEELQNLIWPLLSTSLNQRSA